MRTSKATRNVIIAVCLSVITIFIGLISQRVFINTLGTEYLGVNGLFTSIVSMLALVELGLGSAIYYHLYKPIADKDTAKVKSLVSFYKKAYRIVAIAILLLGLSVIPFLSNIVGEVTIDESLNIIFMLFLLDSVFSYLLIYKRVVLYVDQNNHIISIVHLGYIILLNALQIATLILTQNFYLYLIIKIIMRIIENVILSVITDRKYDYLKDKSIVALDNETKSDIYKKIRGLAYHKIGAYIVLGTDNIIISIFFGIATVGLYSNYLLVISAIWTLASQIFVAITASVGNLLVEARNSKSYIIFKRLHFGNFWLACLATTSFLVIMNSFIALWIGEQYLLPTGVVVALSINLYLALMRSTMNSFKEAAGIFHQDRFVPIVESIANLIFSLILLHYLGLAGVFLGTALSTLILHMFSYPKFVFQPLFKQSYIAYYSEFLKYAILAATIGWVTLLASGLISAESNFVTVTVNLILCLIIPNAILYLIFRNSSELDFYKALASKTLRSFKDIIR